VRTEYRAGSGVVGDHIRRPNPSAGRDPAARLERGTRLPRPECAHIVDSGHSRHGVGIRRGAAQVRPSRRLAPRTCRCRRGGRTRRRSLVKLVDGVKRAVLASDPWSCSSTTILRDGSARCGPRAPLRARRVRPASSGQREWARQRPTGPRREAARGGTGSSPLRSSSPAPPRPFPRPAVSLLRRAIAPFDTPPGSRDITACV
jgi:hypothetical protein